MKNNRLADSANLGGALQPRNPASANRTGTSLRVRTQNVRKRLAWFAALLACFGTGAFAGTNSAVTLVWNANPESDIAGYRLSYGTSPGQYSDAISVGTNPTATVPGLIGGNTYYFVVTAINQAGLQSPQSSEISHQVAADDPVPTTGWTVHYVDSEEALDAAARLAFDGNPETIWHTAWRNGSATPGPHEIQVNLGAIQNVNGFTYLPRQDESTNGDIGQYEFYVSQDGVNWGSAVAAGTFANSKSLKEVAFTAKTGRFIRFRSLSSANGGIECSIAELKPLFAADGLPTNEAPVAVAGSSTTAEDTPVSVVLTGTDADGNVLTFTVVSNPTKGTLSGIAPNLTYTPTANANGSDSFTFRVNDGTVNSATATVSIAITPVNDAPVALAKSVTTAEDTAAAVVLTGTDPDSDALTFTVLTNPSKGTLSGTAPNLTYTPTADANGSDSFTFRVNDGTVNSTTATVSITNTQVNDAPVALAKSITTAEDTPVAAVITGSDAEGDALTFTVVSNPTKGTLSGTAPNLTYTPTADANGSDSFTFRVNDGTVNSTTATVSMTITPVNDAPVALAKSVTTAEDAAAAMVLTGTDPDGDALTFTVVTSPTKGTLSGTAPNLTYTPTANANGSDSFTFRVNDGTVNSTTATVSISITPVNDAPVAVAKSVTTAEDSPVAVVLTGSDLEGDALTFTVVTSPTKGTLSGTAPSLTYTPTADANGSDSFTFRVNDGTANSTTSTVSITITPVNDAPVAVAKSVTTAKNIALPITLTGTDKDADSLTYSVLASSSSGTLSGTAPNLTYTPASNFTGSDSFTFLVNDGTVNSALATVSINVTTSNAAPLAIAQSITTLEDTPSAVTLGGTDSDGDTLTFTVLTNPAKGTLTGTPPNLTFTPTSNANGSDSFTFQVNDGTVNSTTATVSIAITPVNDAPVALAKSVTTAEDTAVAVILTGTDGEGDALTFTVVTSPIKGTLSGTAPNLTYTPTANANGSDSFTFRVNDGTVNSTTATVSIAITTMNDAPVAVAKSVTTAEDSPVAVVLTGSDLEGDALTFTVVTSPTKGTLSGTAPNLTYTPTADANGSDSFTFRVNDGTVNSTTATVSIAITPVNDAPVAVAKSVTTAKNISLPITLTGTDKDADSLTYSVLASSSNGTLSGTAPNLTYTPASNFTGSDSFTFLVNDGTVNSALATVSINVTTSNTTPLAIAQSITALEDTPFAVTLGGTDSDGDTLTFTVLTNPAKGTLSGTPPNLTFTPTSNANGSDSFTFRVSDGSLNSAAATVAITITPVNDAPLAFAESITTEQETPALVELSGSDSEDTDLTFTIVSPPAFGSLSGTAPDVSYMPNAGFHGSDSFTYRVNDGSLDSNTATVSITVTEFVPPTEVALVSRSGWTLKYVDSEEGQGYLATSAFDGKPETFWHTQWREGATPPPHEIQINLGSLQSVIGFRYLPRQDEIDNGNIAHYEFYVSMDGTNWGDPVATGEFINTAIEKEVHFTAKIGRYIRLRAITEVNGDHFTSIAELNLLSGGTVNQPPLASSQSLTTPEGSPLQIRLSGSDPEGAALSYFITSNPAHGQLTGTPPNLTYTPEDSFAGSDQFSFRANDGAVDSAPVTVSITVTPVEIVIGNVPPVFAANPMVESATQGQTFSGQLIATDANAGDTLTFTKLSGPAWLGVSSSGVLSGIPTNANVGANAFSVRVSDNSNASATAVLNILVANRNDPPVFVLTKFVLEDGIEQIAYSDISLSGSATDPDKGDSIIYSKSSGPRWLTIARDGMLSGTPPVGTAGINQFTIRAADRDGAYSEAIVQILVEVNSLPLPWNVDRIGRGNLEGTASQRAGIFTLSGAGALTATADAGNFGWQTLTGDGQITVRVSQLDDTGSDTRVGVMIRGSLAPDARLVFVGVDGDGKYQWIQRAKSGGKTSKSTEKRDKGEKMWLRLVRKKDTFTAYKSSNGEKWTEVGETEFDLPKNCYIGLSVSSGSKEKLNTSKFSNVRVTQ